MIKQLSVFLEDTKGKLSNLTRILAENDINIFAFSIADSTDYGIIRFVVGRPELAQRILKENGFSVRVTEVACMLVPNQPGGLNKVLNILSDNDVSIDYMYAFETSKDIAKVVIHTNQLPKLIEVLREHNVLLLDTNQVYQM